MPKKNEYVPVYTLCIGSVRIEELKYKSLWSRIKRWFYQKDNIHQEFVRRQIEEEYETDLVETMKNLER